MKLKLLTKRQNQVMSILWNSTSPLSAQQIRAHDEALNMNTIQQVLRTLLKMNYIRVADIGYSHTVLTRLYSPVISQADYLQFLLGNKSPFEIASSLIDHTMDPKELELLRKHIDEKQKELKG